MVSSGIVAAGNDTFLRAAIEDTLAERFGESRETARGLPNPMANLMEPADVVERP